MMINREKKFSVCVCVGVIWVKEGNVEHVKLFMFLFLCLIDFNLKLCRLIKESISLWSVENRSTKEK